MPIHSVQFDQLLLDYVVLIFYSSAQGFYKVYCKVFERIAEEDYAFLDDVDSDNELPGFGDSLSEYDDVRKH